MQYKSRPSILKKNQIVQSKIWLCKLKNNIIQSMSIYYYRI